MEAKIKQMIVIKLFTSDILTKILINKCSNVFKLSKQLFYTFMDSLELQHSYFQ